MSARGPSLTHIALQAQDLDATIAFYRDYCGLAIVHDRTNRGTRVVWLAERGREGEFILVVMAGGRGRTPAEGDYSHLGFALESRAAVDAIAARARAQGAPPVAAEAGALARRLLLRRGGSGRHDG